MEILTVSNEKNYKFDEKNYTRDFPVKSGWYWCFDTDYPDPSMFFLQQDARFGWRMYSCGGYAQGMPWTSNTFRSLEPITAPSVY